MKDRPAKKMTMSDMVRDSRTKKASSASTTPTDGVSLKVNDSGLLSLEKSIEQYNKSVTDLDPLYSDLRPNGKVLLRLRHMPTKRSGGLIIPPVLRIPVPTKNGYGYVDVVDCPWKFDLMGVIVASYNESIFPPGTLVQLNRSVVQGTKPGSDFDFVMPYAFMHYSYGSYEPPKSMEDRHYGYHLVPPDMIEVFLP